MCDYSIETLDELPASIVEMVDRGHGAHEAQHGIVCDYKRFSMVIRSAAGDPLGVLSAYTAYAEIYVDDIWVDADHRRMGLGRKLLETLETAYAEQGYNNINLVTNRFQAEAFYERCGYEVEFVRENKHHPQLSKTFFIKYFEGETQTQGILGT